VFSETTHMLNGRKIDPKKAMARGGRDPVRKVFVGGLPPDFPESEIRDYFGKFGKVSTIINSVFIRGCLVFFFLICKTC
jgi:heterogeneous nuclear ribonucleoprotein A/B/D